MKKLVIDRLQWLRGEEASIGSALLDSISGKMCCLGFLSIAEGYTAEQIINKSYPRDLDEYEKKLPEALQPLVNGLHGDGVPSNSVLCEVITEANDSNTTTDAAREAFIKEKFIELGYEVEFIN